MIAWRAVRRVWPLTGIRGVSSHDVSFASVLLLSVSLIPVGFIAASIAIFSVNSPWLEEWDQAVWFEKLADYTLSFPDLFAQQNEFRSFFPNLVFVFLGSLSKGDVRLSMLATFLVACLVSFNIYRIAIYRIARLQRDAAPTSALVAYMLANLMIFSPVQYENWLQGQQLMFFGPIACLSACLLIALSPTLAPTTRWGG